MRSVIIPNVVSALTPDNSDLYIFFQAPYVYVLDPSSMMIWREKYQKSEEVNISDNRESPHEMEVKNKILAKTEKLTQYGFFKPKHFTTKSEVFDINNVNFIVLNPNTKCNLSCWYCYVDPRVREKRIEADFETFKYFLEVFINHRKRGNPTPLSISCCYTNEITINFDYFLKLYEYIKSIDASDHVRIFLPSTNLLEVDLRFINFINNYGFLAVSIDLFNNRHINVVLRNLSLFDNNVIKSCHIAIQPSMTEFFEKYVFLMNYFDFVAMRPVRLGYDRKFSWNNETLELLDRELKKLVIRLISLSDENLLRFLLKIGDTDYFSRYFRRILERKRIKHRCPAGINAISFGPDNNIYPCSGLTGSDYICGSVNGDNQIIINNLIFQYYVDEIEHCRKCPIRYYCGGPCLDWKNKADNKTIVEEECAINQIFFRNAAVLALELFENRKEVLKTYVKKKEIELRLNYNTSFSAFVETFTTSS